jgi:hypothetical protein
MTDRGGLVRYDNSSIDSVVGYSNSNPVHNSVHYKSDYVGIGALIGAAVFGALTGSLGWLLLGALGGGAIGGLYNAKSSKIVEQLKNSSPKLAEYYSRAVGYAKKAAAAGCKTEEEVSEYIKSQFDGEELDDIVAELKESGSHENSEQVASKYSGEASKSDSKEQQDNQPEEAPDAAEE